MYKKHKQCILHPSTGTAQHFKPTNDCKKKYLPDQTRFEKKDSLSRQKVSEKIVLKISTWEN